MTDPAPLFAKAGSPPFARVAAGSAILERTAASSAASGHAATGRAAAARGARQRGAASIEFAFALVLLLMFLFAIVGYGALLWAQQKVTHLAAEGARSALAASFEGDAAAAQGACAGSVLPIAMRDALLAGPAQEAGFCTGSQAACAFAPDATCATVEIRMRVDGWPLLEIMRGLARVFDGDTQRLLPEQVQAKAVVQIPMEPAT